MGVYNGRIGQLYITGVHDGDAGVQDADGRLRVGFTPNRRLRSPLAARAAVLDGRPHSVLSARRSDTLQGVYVLELAVDPQN